MANSGPPNDKTEQAIGQFRHDLRTPLNHILGYAELLRESAGQELQSDLANIVEAARAMVKEIDRACEGMHGLLREARGTPTSPPDGGVIIDPLPPRATDPPMVDDGPDEVSPSMWSGSAILVVDDNAKNRDLLSRLLTQRGFRVEVADSGQAALAAIGSRSFDLVLLDVMMPGLSGMDVLRRVRRTTTVAELPIIMATARDSAKDVVQALEWGANDYVTKPINLPVLLARAETQLALREANEKVLKLVRQLDARNKFIRDMFGRYLTDEVVETLLASPRGLGLGGEMRRVTVLLSDLRGFSSLSERLAPPQVIALLNHYLGEMTKIIVKHGGTIDEFIGDAILVVFGAPASHSDHAARAVECAVEMQLEIPRVNEFNVRNGLPPIEMGIGINTGDVVVGNIGSDQRAKYGVVGRSVNLASRIEALTIGGQVLISESTLTEAGQRVRVEAAREVSLKGARGMMKVYEVRGFRGAVERTLPRQTAPLLSLAKALPVRFAVLDGVSVPLAMEAASLVALGGEEAVLATPSTLPLARTLKLQLPVSDSDPSEFEAYAKVVRAEARGYVVHFTSVSPEVERFLQAASTSVA